MSSSQSAPRRLSARLKDKEDVPPVANGYFASPIPKTRNAAASRNGHEAAPASKKRKIGRLQNAHDGHATATQIMADHNFPDYDEEDDGFLFTRAKTRKTKASTSTSTIQTHKTTQLPLAEKPLPNVKGDNRLPDANGDHGDLHEKKRKKMSFSTPFREEKPVRRSKRLSDEHDERTGSPLHKARRKDAAEPVKKPDKGKPPERKEEVDKTPAPAKDVQFDDEHSATKISLPFADTPVIRRNKAMREGKSSKGGERRSSLGLRGRRASSLIDSGTSNGKQTSVQSGKHTSGVAWAVSGLRS